MYTYMLDGKQKTKCMLGRLSHPFAPALGGPAGYSSAQVSASSSAEAKASQRISPRDFTTLFCVSQCTQ